MALSGLALPVMAQSTLEEISRAVVLVACDKLQGSGTVINGVDGYVLTDGHVTLDIHSLKEAETCRVFFADAFGKPTLAYKATIVHAVFNEKLNQDFAILKIGDAIGTDRIARPFPSVKTNEFTTKGDAVTLIGYSDGDNGPVVSTGEILDYIGGFIRTSAEVSPGDSGGTALDEQGNLFGVPTRIVSITDGDQQSIYYELVDIRAVMNWLDTFGSNTHDLYFNHSDKNHYHRSAVYITQNDLGCLNLARSASISSVYCLMGDGTRSAFPMDKTFFSWYPNFDAVDIFDDDVIADHRLVRNATFKPGTLIKSSTSPNVYVVVDSFGVLRLIPNEAKAIELWGPAWASLVFDIPDTFWANYSIGQPIEM